MRGLVASLDGEELEFELLNPHPLADALPGVFQEAWLDEQLRYAGGDPFAPRFLSAFDSSLAPIVATLDNVDAYFDPQTTPDDFLAWLGEWVAVTADDTWTADRRRTFVAQAAEIYRLRGTAEGLRRHVQIHTGGEVEVAENGSSAWSTTADGELPGSPEPIVLVTVRVDDPTTIDAAKLDALVRAAKPAHLLHRIEIAQGGARSTRKRMRGATDPDTEATT